MSASIAPLKAIVLDVDGTLLTSQHAIADTTRRAIARAQAARIEVVLASARSPAAMRAFVEELELTTPVVAFNGALVCDPSGRPTSGANTAVSYRIPKASALRLITYAVDLGLEIGWHAGDSWYAPVIGDGLRREAEITGQKVELLSAQPHYDDPHKLLAIAASANSLPALARLRNKVPADCRAQYSHRNYVEITARSVTKAVAITRVCAAMGIDAQATAAIGDGENDIELLRAAGIGIAMGHAPPALQEAADWVTATNDEDGVAQAIDRLLSRDVAPDRTSAVGLATDR